MNLQFINKLIGSASRRVKAAVVSTQMVTCTFVTGGSALYQSIGLSPKPPLAGMLAILGQAKFARGPTREFAVRTCNQCRCKDCN